MAIAISLTILLTLRWPEPEISYFWDLTFFQSAAGIAKQIKTLGTAS